MGFDQQASYYAKLYIRNSMVGVYFMTFYSGMNYFVISLGKSSVPMIVITITTILHFLWSYLLVIYLEWGIEGSGIAMSITYFLDFALLYIGISLNKEIKEAWFLPTKESF